MESSEEDQVKARPFASEKLYQSHHRPLRTFFHRPVPRVLQSEESHVGRHQLHLIGQEVSIGFFASNREHRQGELGLRKLGKIAGGLLERNEVGSARAHASRLGAGLGAQVRFRDRVCLVGGEVVPEMFEASRLAALRQRLRGGPAPVLMRFKFF
jgi:hypothetical protein